MQTSLKLCLAGWAVLAAWSLPAAGLLRADEPVPAEEAMIEDDPADRPVFGSIIQASDTVPEPIAPTPSIFRDHLRRVFSPVAVDAPVPNGQPLRFELHSASQNPYAVQLEALAEELSTSPSPDPNVGEVKQALARRLRDIAGSGQPAGAIVTGSGSVSISFATEDEEQPGVTERPLDIPEGMRLVTVPVQLKDGDLIRPGDRVDVQVSYRANDHLGSSSQKAKVLMGGIRVFATERLHSAENSASAESAESTRKDVSLLVTPDQASRLLLAESKGKIQLTLRKQGDEVGAGSVSINEQSGTAPPSFHDRVREHSQRIQAEIKARSQVAAPPHHLRSPQFGPAPGISISRASTPGHFILGNVGHGAVISNHPGAALQFHPAPMPMTAPIGPEDQQLMQKIGHLMRAAAELEQAGLGDQARHVREEAEPAQAELQRRRAAAVVVVSGVLPQSPQADVVRALQELRQEVQRLRGEVHELRNAVRPESRQPGAKQQDAFPTYCPASFGSGPNSTWFGISIVVQA